VKKIGSHPARRDGLDADAELTQLESHALAPAFERPLGRMVDEVERHGY
jgi:hypothetical protein